MTTSPVRDSLSAAASPIHRLAVSAVTALLLATVADGSALAGQEEEPGRLKGRVLSAREATPVTSAEVFLVDTEIGTLTDLEGRYFLSDVPPGTYDLTVRALGHATTTVTGVEVDPGETSDLSVSLETEAVAVGDLEISVGQARGSAAALLNRQRTADAVSDGIGTEQISRSPASDAAEAARRMTGVTVSDGKYVYVRGLGERYSQTSLNGSPLPSPEPESSVVPLDLFPAGFLESLVAQKTYTADRPGDFSGGTVQIETREFPDELTFRLSVGSSLNSESQFSRGFLYYDGGGLDMFGIDDGSRALPDGFVRELGGLEGDRVPNDPETRERIGETFLESPLTEFAPASGTTPPNGDVGFSLGNRTELFGKTFGYLIAANYSNSFTFRDDEVERKFRSTNFDPDLSEARRQAANVDYSFVRGMQEVKWGGIGNFNLQLSPGHQLSLKTLYNRTAEDEARQYTGANREDLGGELFTERLRFISRQLAWGQLAGKHQVLNGNRIEWKLSAARATREEPGLRETIYKRGFGADPSEPFLLDNTGESARYLFSDLTDDDLNGQADWIAPLPWPGGRNAELKLGVAARTRDRDFAARRLRWEFLSGSRITSLDSALNAGSIVGQVDEPGEFALTEVVEPGDAYTADDETRAGYAMLTLPVGRLKAVLGARLEDYELELATRNASLEAGLGSTDVLPAANVTYALTDRMNLRAAASRTMDRPEFRELAPFQFTEAASLRQVFGNPELQIAEITSLDLRWEWFPTPGEVLTLSAFRKHMDDPIEQVFIATAGTAYSYQNADSAELYGAELGWRKGMGFLAGWLSPVTFEGNLALIESEVDVRSGGIFQPTNLTRELEGQSPYTVNLSLAYQDPDGATEAGAYFNVFGERIAAAGGSGVPDIVEQPRAQLDFTLKQDLWPRVELKLKAENLLDSAHLWEQSAHGITRVQRRYTEGRSFSASLTYGG